MVVRAVVAAAFAMSLMSSAAQGAVFFYTDAADFDSVVVGTATETFDDASLIDGLSVVSDYETLARGALRDQVMRDGAGTTFLFEGGATAFGGNFDLSVRGYGPGLIFTLLFDDGHQEQLSQRITRASNPFFGFATDNPFVGVHVGLGGPPRAVRETYTLDDLRVRSARGGLASLASAAPEPAGWAMMILGFGGAGAALRNRRKRSLAA